MAILDELTEQEVSKNKAIRGYAFCVGVVLFCQISQPAPVPSPRRSIWLDRAVDVRQSLFYNSGKVLRLGVDVCHLRQGFPLPKTETLRRPVPSCRR